MNVELYNEIMLTLYIKVYIIVKKREKALEDLAAEKKTLNERDNDCCRCPNP